MELNLQPKCWNWNLITPKCIPDTTYSICTTLHSSYSSRYDPIGKLRRPPNCFCEVFNELTRWVSMQYPSLNWISMYLQTPVYRKWETASLKSEWASICLRLSINPFQIAVVNFIVQRTQWNYKISVTIFNHQFFTVLSDSDNYKLNNLPVSELYQLLWDQTPNNHILEGKQTAFWKSYKMEMEHKSYSNHPRPYKKKICYYDLWASV